MGITDVSWISPGEGITVQCVQLCCGNEHPYNLYPTRLTLRSNSTVKLQQAIDYIDEYHLHVIGARTDEYERLYYEEVKDSSSLSTIEGYFAALVGFGALVATCVHFQNEEQEAKKNNARLIQDSYSDPNSVDNETKNLQKKVSHRYAVMSPNHVNNIYARQSTGEKMGNKNTSMGRSKMDLFGRQKDKYGKMLKQGTMLGLGRRLEDDSFDDPESEDIDESYSDHEAFIETKY